MINVYLIRLIVKIWSNKQQNVSQNSMIRKGQDRS